MEYISVECAENKSTVVINKKVYMCSYLAKLKKNLKILQILY